MKKICSLWLVCVFLSVISFSGKTAIHSPVINFSPNEKDLTVSNRTKYPIVSTQVSGSGGFRMVSGGNHVLFLGEIGALTFTIDTALWGCSFVVSALFSDGEIGVVNVNLCEIEGERMEITFFEEKSGK